MTAAPAAPEQLRTTAVRRLAERASGLRAVWQERRQRVRQLPRRIRIGRRVALILVLGVLGGVVVDRFLLTVDVVVTGGIRRRPAPTARR